MDISSIDKSLPPYQPIHRQSEADYYGASNLISAGLGYAAPPRSVASWKHGVSYEKDYAFPELLLTEGNRLTRHLVANDWQVIELRERGYVRVHAVGVPYLYVPPSTATRISNSLLVMPAHTLFNSSHEFDEREYVDQIVTLRNQFDFIVACVSATCIKKGVWIHTFEKAGIPWIAGADSTDGNALRRMEGLFRRFDFVTTNTLGSHVAYAAFSGCKVSIWGPYAEPKLEYVRGIPWHEKHWRKLSERMERLSESHVRRKHALLFCDPWDAETRRQWAEPYLGKRFSRDLPEVARLLGWTTSGQFEVRVHLGLKRVAGAGQKCVRKIRNFATREGKTLI